MRWLRIIGGCTLLVGVPLFSLFESGSEGVISRLSFVDSTSSAVARGAGPSSNPANPLEADGHSSAKNASGSSAEAARKLLGQVLQGPAGVPSGRFPGSRFVGVGQHFRTLEPESRRVVFPDGTVLSYQESELALHEMETEVSLISNGRGLPLLSTDNPFSLALDESKDLSRGGEETDGTPLDPNGQNTSTTGDESPAPTPVADQPAQEKPPGGDDSPADEKPPEDAKPEKVEDPPPVEPPAKDDGGAAPPPPLAFLMMNAPKHPAGGYVQRAYQDRKNASLFVGEDGTTLVFNSIQLLDAVSIRSDSMLITRDMDANKTIDLVLVRNNAQGAQLDLFKGRESSRLSFDQSSASYFLPGRRVLNMALFDLDSEAPPEIILQLHNYPRLVVVESDEDGKLKIGREIVLPFRVGLIFDWLDVRAGKAERRFYLFDDALERAFVISSNEPDFLLEATSIPLASSFEIAWNPEKPASPTTLVLAFESAHRLILFESTARGLELSASFDTSLHVPVGLIGDLTGSDETILLVLP